MGLILVGSLTIYVGLLAIAFLWNITRGLVHALQAGAPDVPLATQTCGADPTVVVLLVHGTWSANARWMRHDSALCHSIRAALPHETLHFVQFRWSGRNSISARHKAAKAFGTLVMESRSKWPLAKHIVVAHSHGGAVALSAFLTSSAAVDGIACLSTPFLIARPRSLSTIGQQGLSVTPALFAVFGFAAFINAVGLEQLADRYEALKFAFGLLMLFAGVFVWRKTPRIVEQLANDLLSKLRLGEPRQDALLIIRAPGDEASAALGAVLALNFVVSRIWDIMSWILDEASARADQWRDWLNRCGWSVYAVNVSLMAIGVWLQLSSWVAAFISEPMILTLSVTFLSCSIILWFLLLFHDLGKLVGILCLGVIAAPLTILLALLAVPFGLELALVSLVLNVTAESTPPGSWVVHQLRPSGEVDRWDALMHSVAYEDPAALATLVDWIQQRLRIARMRG